MKLDSSRQIFEKLSNTKFHENSYSCSVWTDGQTDRHEAANIIRNLANEPKNGYVIILVKETLRCNSIHIHNSCRGHGIYS